MLYHILSGHVQEENSQEETDTQIVYLKTTTEKFVCSDDADVLVLLVYHFGRTFGKQRVHLC